MLRLTLALVVLLAAPAVAATVDDVAVGETDHAELAVWGRTVAWRSGASVVLRSADGRERSFPWRGASSGLTIGPDAAGRLVLVFPFCSSAASSTRCRLRRVDVASGRAGFVAGVPAGALSTPVLRRGVLAWIDGAAVRSRALAGGRTRREDLGREAIDLTGLDHDGRRFAITGEAPSDPDTETSYTDVRVGRLGRRGTRRVGGLGSSQEYQAVLRPLLNATSVDVLKDDLSTFTAGDAYERLIRYPFGRGRRLQRSFGVPFVAFARGGGGTALVQAPGPYGCAVERPDPEAFDEEVETTAVPCRVVLAGSAPFGTATRRTVPEIAITRTATRLSGRVVRRLIAPASGRTAGTSGVAGVPVRVAAPNAASGFGTSGVDATTDAAGAFSVALPSALAKASMLGAFTTAAPRAFVGAAAPVPGRG